jgi:ribosomal protein S27AE
VTEDEGGDPVCWLHLACPECGAIPDPGEEETDRCPRCGAQKQPSEGSAPDR